MGRLLPLKENKNEAVFRNGSIVTPCVLREVRVIKLAREEKKICFAASSGGHLEELSRLSGLIREKDFVVTEAGQFASVTWCDKVKYMPQINRKEILFPFKFFLLFVRSFILFLKEKPDVVVSTGALVTYPIGIIAKIFGRKIVYIESFARVDHPSLTGKLYYKIADVFIVQWEDMLKFYPAAVYVGGIF